TLAGVNITDERQPPRAARPRRGLFLLTVPQIHRYRTDAPATLNVHRRRPPPVPIYLSHDFQPLQVRHVPPGFQAGVPLPETLCNALHPERLRASQRALLSRLPGPAGGD